jgi:hypothetical protein
MGLLSSLGVNDGQLHNHLTPKEAAFNNYQDIGTLAHWPKLLFWNKSQIGPNPQFAINLQGRSHSLGLKLNS